MQNPQNDFRHPNPQPLVSIIVPIYNVAAYLSECLQSLVGQSYGALDIILIDDGSDDESLKIALDFAARDGRIFVVSKPNGGLSSARNFGLEFVRGTGLREGILATDETAQIRILTGTNTFNKSHKTLTHDQIRPHFTQITPNFIKSDLAQIGDFITQELPPNALIHFVDSDDYLASDCIEKCVQALCERDLDIAAHKITHFYESGGFKADSFLKNIRQDAYESGLELLRDNNFTQFYFSWQGLFRAEILNRYALRFCEGIYHEDHDFGMLLFALAGKIARIDEPLYIYRERPNSTITSAQSAQMPAKMPYFLEPLRAYFGDYRALREYFKAYCFVLIGVKIWHFYEQKSENDGEFKRKFKDFFTQSALAHMKIFKTPLNPDPLGIKALLQSVKFTKTSVLRDFFKDLHRQPKKLLYIANLKYLLTSREI